MAENFQEMFLRVILDRLEFVSKFVELGAESRTNTSTFYLLLPVILKEYDDVMKVDWETVKRCLCSPIFRHPVDTLNKKVTPLDNHLQLANGYRSVRDVENSLVYVPHTKFFYCVTDIIYEKNGFSPYKDSNTSNYADHFNEK
jgi:endoribonuclease Dicer